MECLPTRSKMVTDTDIKVKVHYRQKNIYENALKNEGNDLNSLISNLKSMQQQVNEILTKLVEVEQRSNQESNVVDSDNDGDEAEGDKSEDDDGKTKPKRNKYK